MGITFTLISLVVFFSGLITIYYQFPGTSIRNDLRKLYGKIFSKKFRAMHFPAIESKLSIEASLRAFSGVFPQIDNQIYTSSNTDESVKENYRILSKINGFYRDNDSYISLLIKHQDSFEIIENVLTDANKIDILERKAIQDRISLILKMIFEDFEIMNDVISNNKETQKEIELKILLNSLDREIRILNDLRELYT